MEIKTVGSVCSGIEAASAAWAPLGLQFEWFSEIAPFPSAVLKEKYPDVPNLGDMNDLPALITARKAAAPDLICAGPHVRHFPSRDGKTGSTTVAET